MSRSSPETETVPEKVILDHFDNLIWDVIYADRRTQAADRANYRDENEGRIEAWQKLQEAIREQCFGHAQTPADTYRETVRKVAAAREKRRAELQVAVVAAHAAFEAIPIGFPLQQNGRTIDHTLLNEAKRLCELALSDTSTLGNSK